MLYRQLSKLAVVSERSEAPKANQSRLRRPTPSSIEHYRHEGISADAKNDDSSDNSPRGRSRSSTWTPTRTRAPTPHPSASKSRPRKEKTVRWTDSLEQESPEQKCEPATAPSRKKSALKRQPATQQEEEKSTEKEDRPDNSPEEPAKPKTDKKATSTVAQPYALRRDRRSSIPRPKFAVTLSRSNTSKRIAAAERPPSPLIPQVIPAPLRLSQRRSRIPAIPSSASAPEVSAKTKHDSSAIKPSDKNQPVPTSARDFSFDAKPEALSISSRSTHHSRTPNTTKDNLLSSGSTSYLQAKPKRNATIRPAPRKPETQPACTEDSSNIKISTSASPVQTREIKPTASLPKSSSTQTFATAKSFWAEKSASAGAGAGANGSDRNPAMSKPTSTSKPASATVDLIPSRSSPSKSLPSKPLPSSTSTSTFQSAKGFWSGLSASSSCGAIVDGSISETPKPALPRNVSDLPKTSMVSNLSRYTVNGGDHPEGEKRGARRGDTSGSMSSTAVNDPSKLSAKLSSGASSYRSGKAKNDVTTTGKNSSSKIPLPKPQDQSKLTAGSSVITTKSTTSSSTYHTAKSHLSTTGASDTNANASTPMAAIPTSIEADNIPTIQGELWNEIMNFCRSDSSSVPPGERYCDCDDCVWSNEKDLKGCSTVARVGGGNCRARRN